MGEACRTHAKVRNSNNISVGKSSGKTSLREPRTRWVDNIKIDVTETGCQGVDWIHVACDMAK